MGGLHMFEWKKEFVLGIDSVDEDHKELFHYANRIYDLLIIRSDNPMDDLDEIKTVIDDLRKHTQMHFRKEEALFRKYNFPDAEEHTMEHQVFLEYLDNFEVVATIQQPKETLKGLIERLANWVFHHMITTDYLFKVYLMNMGQIEDDEAI
jgi:hemerythrin